MSSCGRAALKQKVTVNGSDMQIGDRRSGPTWPTQPPPGQFSHGSAEAGRRGLTKDLEQHDPMKPTHLHNLRCPETLLMEASDKK